MALPQEVLEIKVKGINKQADLKPTGYINDHGYIDLGLSVKWAVCNIGASILTGYGDHFAWGEIKTKSDYSERNSRTNRKRFDDIAGKKEFDAASAYWGGSWRLPTKDELQELMDKCTWEWSVIEGHYGFCVTSKINGKTIFLPASGFCNGEWLNGVGMVGSYWSSTPHESSNVNAYYLTFNKERRPSQMTCDNRFCGRLIRPVSGPMPQVEKKQLNESVSKPTGYINKHGYVDLGLSVKWATCNVGASKPEACGELYAWGETENKNEFTEDNCKTCELLIGNIAGKPEYDVASSSWGDTWRMPTKAEYQELIDKCDWMWTTKGGHDGYCITSRVNGKSIFLPAAGKNYGKMRDMVGVGGYWTSSPSSSDTRRATSLYFHSVKHYISFGDGREHGLSVRPVSGPMQNPIDDEQPLSVSEPTGLINGYGYVDLGLSVKWATCDVGASSFSESGRCYAWGETDTKKEYTKANYKIAETHIIDIAGNSEYDVANAQWGSPWRMPTKSECQELLEKCNWKKVYQYGQHGYIVSSKSNGNCIFLPMGSWFNEKGIQDSYWSSTSYDKRPNCSFIIQWNELKMCSNYAGNRVRPVLE